MKAKIEMFWNSWKTTEKFSKKIDSGSKKNEIIQRFFGKKHCWMRTEFSQSELINTHLKLTLKIMMIEKRSASHINGRCNGQRWNQRNIVWK